MFLYTDGAEEYRKAADFLRWAHHSTPPYEHESNAVAERQVRRVKEGTRAILMQAGLPPSMWAHAARHFCFAANIEKPVSSPEAKRNLLIVNRKYAVQT